MNSNNTEWLPTKCRITKPPPPKPATNPLQFIRVTSCPLYQKTQEQIKKVEEVKVTRQDINDDAEEWQQNLDNWKSSRKKRQEHIIERVVEVKRLEEEEHERTRRKSKTFNEILQERNKRGHRLNIPLYDNSDDLNEYYTNSSNDKTSCIRNTNENNISYEKSEEIVSELQSANDQFQASNQDIYIDCNNATNSNVIIPVNNEFNSSTTLNESLNNIESNNLKTNTEPQYTYEGAIQDYRTRIKSKINIKTFCNNQEDNFENKESAKIQNTLSKIDVYKRKEIFEIDKPAEIKKIENNTSKKLLDEFVNSQSIKERLKSLEKCTDQSLQPIEKGSKSKQWNKQNEIVTKDKFLIAPKLKKDQIFVNINPSNSSSNNSTETNIFMKKFDKCNKDYLDNCECDWYNIQNVKNVESTRTVSLLSDQGNNTLVDNNAKELNQNNFNKSSTFTLDNNVSSHKETDVQIPNINKNIINATKEFLDAVRYDADLNYAFEMSYKYSKTSSTSHMENIVADKLFVENVNKYIEDSDKLIIVNDDYIIDKSIIFDNENMTLSNGTCTNALFPLAPPRNIEPPKEKPPPPPSSDLEYFEEKNTEQIKQELFIKRSSFLKLDESTDDPINSELFMGKDIDNVFYQNETQLDRSEYKKLQGSFSEVDSQDSGLESERGRLSSDTWCSNFGDPSTPTHGRQDSEKTNSITSEEDEIAKKEREIIELVEKEEKSRNIRDYSPNNKNIKLTPSINSYNVIHKSPKKLEELTRSDFFERNLEYKSNFNNCNSKLKVEQLQDQIEDNTMYKDNPYHSNRHSLDNISYMENVLPHTSSYRKSMPDIQNTLLDTPYYKSVSTIELQCCKSMPDIQKAHFKSVSGYKKNFPKITNGMELPNEHRKSMPELKDTQIPVYRSPSYIHSSKLKDEENQTTYNQYQNTKSGLSELRINPHLSTSYAKNNTVIPSKKSSSNVKNYSRHWLYHEAELRRLAQQTNNSPKRTWQQIKQIESVTQNVIPSMQNIPVDRNLWTRRSENKSNNDLHSYLNYSQMLGSDSPVVYPLQDQQHKMLSVSGKKKCSYCENELGRGAAMIIESLCLFYHMECFKCCVCHTQLGDGLIGTDVRVRNQKLHCHNCYSSEDGIKLSCV